MGLEAQAAVDEPAVELQGQVEEIGEHRRGDAPIVNQRARAGDGRARQQRAARAPFDAKARRAAQAGHEIRHDQVDPSRLAHVPRRVEAHLEVGHLGDHRVEPRGIAQPFLPVQPARLHVDPAAGRSGVVEPHRDRGEGREGGERADEQGEGDPHGICSE
jgi:hypothetical protein